MDQNASWTKIEPKQDSACDKIADFSALNELNEAPMEQQSFQMPIKLLFGASISIHTTLSSITPKVESCNFVKTDSAPSTAAVIAIAAPKVESAENSSFFDAEHIETSDTVSEAAHLHETRSDLTEDDDEIEIEVEESTNGVMNNIFLSVYMSNLRTLNKKKSLAVANSSKKVSKRKNTKKGLKAGCKKRKRDDEPKMLSLISPSTKRIALKSGNTSDSTTVESSISQLATSLDISPSENISEMVVKVPEPTFAAVERAQSGDCPSDCLVAL
jgi:hypothetical protein